LEPLATPAGHKPSEVTQIEARAFGQRLKFEEGRHLFEPLATLLFHPLALPVHGLGG